MKATMVNSRIAAWAVALAIVAAATAAQATLILDFRATGATGNGTLVNNKSVTVTGAGGGTVTFDVYARVLGTDTTGTNDELGIANFGATSYGGLVLGDATNGMATFVSIGAPWNGSGASAGTAQVLLATQPTGTTPVAPFFYDGDTDRDVGGGAQTSAGGWIAVRGTGTGGFNGTVSGNPGTLIGEGSANAGMEWKLGSLTYTWLTTSGVGTTNINAVLRTFSSGASWKEESTTKNPTTVGTSYTRGTDIVISALSSGNNSQIMIDTTLGGSQTPSTGASSKTIDLGKILYGSASTLTTASQTINKTGTDGTTYSVTTGGDVSSTQFTSGSFAGGSQSASGTITLNTATAGNKSGTVTIANTAGDSGAGGQGSADANDVFTVTAKVGSAKAAATPGPGLNTFVVGEALSAVVGVNGSYAGLGSSVDVVASAGSGAMAFGSDARFLAGTSTGTAHTVAMNWRARAAAETPGSSTAPLIKVAPVNGLYSDVVQITGMGANAPHVQTDAFVLQMTYDPNALPGGAANEQFLADNGYIYLGWLNEEFNTGDGGATTADRWQYAVSGNFYGGGEFKAIKGFVGTYADYLSGTVTKATLAGTKTSGAFQLGDWGVDPQSNTVWAVLNHNSQFAVVPEPSTVCILLGASAFGIVGLIRRRRKNG